MNRRKQKTILPDGWRRRLVTWRSINKVSQEALGEQIGISQVSLSNYETYKLEPSQRHRMLIIDWAIKENAFKGLNGWDGRVNIVSK